jgi:CheY-like chemotaxis protein
LIEKSGTFSKMTRPKALLVEDNLPNRMLAEARLKLLGFDVTVEVDGLRALKHLDQREAFDLAVFDHHMPGMTGEELATIARAATEYRDLPILLVTADSQLQIPGIVSHVLQKPYSKAEFEQAIDVAVSQHRASS